MIEQLKEKISDYGKDIRLNIDTVLSVEGAPGLTSAQIGGIALACAFHTECADVISAVKSRAAISPVIVEAAKGATTIMAMNNVYYRFTHLVENEEFTKMPAKLRMNIIAKPGISRVDFELMCLAVSTMEGCGRCIQSHVHELQKAGVTNEGIQSSVRIAAVVSAFSKALSISG